MRMITERMQDLLTSYDEMTTSQLEEEHEYMKTVDPETHAQAVALAEAQAACRTILQTRLHDRDGRWYDLTR